MTPSLNLTLFPSTIPTVNPSETPCPTSTVSLGSHAIYTQIGFPQCSVAIGLTAHTIMNGFGIGEVLSGEIYPRSSGCSNTGTLYGNYTLHYNNPNFELENHWFEPVSSYSFSIEYSGTSCGPFEQSSNTPDSFVFSQTEPNCNFGGNAFFDIGIYFDICQT